MAKRLPLMFIGLSLCAGTALVFIIPPFQSPDETTHFFRAYQISRGQWHSECRAAGCGGEMPSAFGQGFGLFAGLPFQPARKTSLATVEQFVAIPGATTPTTFTTFNNTAIYPIVPYAPAALAMWVVGHWLGEGAPRQLYVGRLADLLTLALLAALAIWLAQGRMRWLLFSLALMPMTLYLSASLTADVLTLGLAFVAAALGSRAAPNGISRRRWWAFVLLVVLLSACKYLYALVPLVAILPASRRRALPAAAFCLLCAFAWWWVFARLPVLPQPQIVGVAPREQILWIVLHPLDAAHVLGRTALAHASFLLKSFVGIFGWLDRPLPEGFYFFYLALLGALLFSGETPGALSVGLVFFFSASAAVASSWLYATPVAGPFIEGIQGRYFIPLFALLGLGWRGRPRISERWVTALALSVVGLGLVVSVRTVLLGYYVF